nr:hypothetical protein [Pseudonocardia sp.]
MTAILALAGLALDGGLALAAKVRAVGQAESAARAGAQAVDLDTYRATGRLVLVPDLAVAAARSQLDAAGAEGEVAVRDGGVVVRVSATHVPRLLGLAGITELTVSGDARAVPQGGVGAADP